jgi:hypothetical protein
MWRRRRRHCVDHHTLQKLVIFGSHGLGVSHGGIEEAVIRP